MSAKTRIAITGIGMVTPLGHDTNSTWNALLAGKSGIDRIQSFDASGFSAQIAAEVKNFRPEEWITDKRLLKYTAGFTQYALAASAQAIADAGVKPTLTTSDRWGLVIGSSMMTAGFNYWQDFHQKYAAAGELDTNFLGEQGLTDACTVEFARMQTNAGLALLGQQHGITGYTISVHTACASGGQALGLGLQAIRRGEADYILAGGYDSMITPVGVGGFCLLGALATFNETPETASRPFDLTRNGFVLGEGAAFLVLEPWEKATARKARIYAELAGEGNTLSAYRITDSHPSGDGSIQAIEMALRDAGISKESIDYVNAHGTSTKMNDVCETNALKAVFGDRAKSIPVSSTKSQTGHLIAGAGALEGAFCALAIHHNKIPMTANLKVADPECDLDYVTEGPRDVKMRAVLSNSLGFGGTNNCLVFKNSGDLQ